MAKHNVVWTKTADIQFYGILEYWLNRNKSTAYSKKLLQRVSEKTRQIADAPLVHKETDFKGIRVASLGNFSIYYKVITDQLIIVAFWDHRQDPGKLLKILKG